MLFNNFFWRNKYSLSVPQIVSQIQKNEPNEPQAVSWWKSCLSDELNGKNGKLNGENLNLYPEWASHVLNIRIIIQRHIVNKWAGGWQSNGPTKTGKTFPRIDSTGSVNSDEKQYPVNTLNSWCCLWNLW